jgi:PEP-CTERM motif
MKKIAAVISLGITILASTTYASTVSWGAAESNGVGLADGTPLPAGDLVWLGSFMTLTNAQVANDMSMGDVSAVLSDFQQFGPGSTIGTGAGGLDGYWSANDTTSANAVSLQNKEIFYFVFNAPTTGAATQYGIFTNTSLPSWVFPDDNAIPNTTTTDLSQVPHDSSGILWGNFGTGSALGFPLYNLAPIAAVPEPSTYALAALGALGLVLLRRRLVKS